LEAFEEFESWLESVRYRRQSIAGRISIIKPWFERSFQHRESHLALRGYLLIFKQGFIGRTLLEDAFYGRIPESMMQQYQFLPKMKVEFEGEVRESRGRIVIHRPGKVEVHSRGWGRPFTRSRSLVDVKTATYFRKQPERCLTCRFGNLVDVRDTSSEGRLERPRTFRHLYCLKGIPDPESCGIKVLEKLWNRSLEE